MQLAERFALNRQIEDRVFDAAAWDDDDWGSDGCPDFCTLPGAWLVVNHLALDFTPRVSGLPGATAFAFWWQGANLWAEMPEQAAERICRAALAIMDGKFPEKI